MRPLVMVHGISSNARKTYGVPGLIWKKPYRNSMYSYLVQKGYRPGIDLFWYSYRTLQPVSISARRLKEEIIKVQKATGEAKIDLLTFSLGGIIGKYYSVSPLYGNEIKKMIMIAPPFLGSHWADWFRAGLTSGKNDLMFAGDGQALSPQILSFNNPFLRELAKTTFPPEIDSTIIAVRTLIKTKLQPIANYVSWLTNWAGEGDIVVPVESTRIPVNQFFEVQEDFSPMAIHRFLPYNSKIQQLVSEELLKIKKD